ncbi:MAG: hypothetical protein CMJ48_13130 [Planctomycetaceae bacterium]|nr:hypothetical protein [Planctomycetaceae bacterium]
MTFPRCAVATIAACLLAASISVVRADDDGKSAVHLLPGSTVAYAEIEQPKELLDVLLTHPLRTHLENLDPYKQAVQSQKYIAFRSIVAGIESQIGMKWDEAVGALTEGGISVAFDPKTEGIAIIVRARDEAALEKLRDAFLKLARDEAKRQGNPDPIKTGEYRGITAYSLGEAKFATFGSWLVYVSDDELGKLVVDSYLDGSESSLADNERFQQARKLQNGKSTLWAYLDIGALRDGGAVEGLTQEKVDNPGAELLAGGILENLQHTPFVVASMTIAREGLGVSVATPHKTEWVTERREYFFGPHGEGAAPPLLAPPETLLALSIYRDFSQMWLRSADLYGESVDAGLAQANSNLSTFFGGKDFGEDILGAFKPGLQFVATRQQFDASVPVPAIKLPAFALVFRFKDADNAPSDFRRTFQSLIGFLNVLGAMNGQPQLDLDIEKGEGTQVVSATYLPEDAQRDPGKAPINFNFSPSVGFVGDRFIIASTKQLARNLVAATKDSDDVRAAGPRSNFAFNLQAAVLRKVLDDNRKQLVAQNMLEEGRDREEAEQQIGLLLDAVALLKNLHLRLETDEDALRLSVELNLARQPE